MSELANKHKVQKAIDNIPPGYLEKAKEQLEKDLGRKPTAVEVSHYLQDTPGSPAYNPNRKRLAAKKAKERAETNRSMANWRKVNPAAVKQAQEDLKELLGRQPTNKEIAKFLEDMYEGS